MNKSHSQPAFDKFNSRHLVVGRGQGLVEYAILIALIGLLAIFGLTLFGGSVQGGLIKVCAALGNADCQTVKNEVVASATVPPTLEVSPTPSLAPIATATLQEPNPPRPPILTVPTIVSTPTGELVTLRIKVVLQGGGKKSPGGIRVVVHNASGQYVAEGVTNDKGKVSFSVVSGSYTVATFYENVWQEDGPFSVKNSKENVIRR